MTVKNLRGFTQSFKSFVLVPENYVLNMLQREQRYKYKPWITHILIAMTMLLVKRESYYSHYKGNIKIMGGG